jgi:tetratricopeptide (TPR) repeat protein
LNAARRLGGWALALLTASATWLAGGRLDRIAPPADAAQELLYLPNGKYLELLSLGHQSLLADVLYLWSIQYYSNYERRDRYRYVEHVFGNVITELDPHYVDPYWLGALILTLEAQDREAGLRLLEKGFRNNPDQWILPYLAGWECYLAQDYDRAAAYFDRAAAVPGAPARVLRLRAGIAGRAGRLDEAIAEWRELVEDPRSDPATRAIAERQVRELQVRADLALLRQAIDRFRSENARFPRRLEELRDRSYIPALPRSPGGGDYAYDPRTGRVSTSSGRVL